MDYNNQHKPFHANGYQVINTFHAGPCLFTNLLWLNW